jgi:hypothetical protein
LPCCLVGENRTMVLVRPVAQVVRDVHALTELGSALPWSIPVDALLVPAGLPLSFCTIVSLD